MLVACCWVESALCRLRRASKYDRHRTYTLPPTAIEPDGRLVLALRVWNPKLDALDSGPYEGSFLIGPLDTLIRQELTSELPHLVLAMLYLLVGLITCSCFCAEESCGSISGLASWPSISVFTAFCAPSGNTRSRISSTCLKSWSMECSFSCRPCSSSFYGRCCRGPSAGCCKTTSFLIWWWPR